MKQLDYPKGSDLLIKLYYLAISMWDKLLIAAVFRINREENNKYVLFVVIKIYDKSINNPDIRQVI